MEATVTRPAGRAPHDLSDSLVGRLNREWLALLEDPAANARAADWAQADPALSDLGSLHAVERATDVEPPEQIDAIFYALERRAVTQDADGDLAARILLQVMLPKVVRIADGQRRRLPDPDERIQLAVTCMYAAIRECPIERRHHHIPPYLAWTANAAVARAVTEQTAEVPDELDEVAEAAPGRNAAEELAELLAWAVATRVISGEDARLLATRYGNDDPSRATWKRVANLDAVAQVSGLTPNAVKKRCSLLARRLAEAAADYVTLSDLM